MDGDEIDSGPLSSYLLPTEADQCEPDNEEKLSFLAGDLRVNENPGLAAMHTLFAREHNRLALKIKALAWHKTDESIMNEARRYVVAEMQNIVYSEFLPAILPQELMTQYNLDTSRDGK